MRTLQNLRHDHPDVSLETRSLLCADRVTRLVSMSPWYWETLDELLLVDDWPISKITGFCLELARRSVDEEGWDHDEAFRELLMYYIYRNWRGFVKVRDNLANDAWEDCFA